MSSSTAVVRSPHGSAPKPQGTFAWLVSACFGKGESADAHSAANRRTRGIGGGQQPSNSYGGVGSSSTAGTSTSHTSGGNKNAAAASGGGKGGKGEWATAIQALIAEIEAGSGDGKIPSFNWRIRSQYGTGATCIGPEGCRRLCDALIHKTRTRRERIATLTIRLQGNSLSPVNDGSFNNFGGVADRASPTPNNNNTNNGGGVGEAYQPRPSLSPEDRARFSAELAALEAAPAHSYKQLDLRAQNIGDDGAEAIAELMAVDEGIEVLILAKNGIGGRGIIALAQGLSQNRAVLKRLVIGEGNEVDSRGAVALCRAIRTQQMQTPLSPSGGGGLSSVGFSNMSANSQSSNNNLMNTYSYNAQQAPQHSALRAPSATPTAASGNGTSPAAQQQPASEFAGTTNGLVELEIGFGATVTLNDDASMALRDVCFSSSSTLRAIKITPSPKAFTVASIGAILRGLAQNRRLASLTFNNCIDEHTLNGPNGARPFLEPFATGALCRADSPLRLLEITNIAIGDSGAKVIADALRLRTAGHLRTLNLTKCAIGPIGFEVLGLMLEQNPFLQRVDLSGNLNTRNAAANNDSSDAGSVNNSFNNSATAAIDQSRALLFAIAGVTGGKGGAASLQELLITDYDVSAESCAAVVDALTASATRSGSSKLRLRTLRYGSCGASDSALTRLHNLLQDNTEAFVAMQKEVQDHQQRQTSIGSGGGSGGAQQGGGANAALISGSSSRRAFVSFNGGGGGGTMSLPQPAEQSQQRLRSNSITSNMSQRSRKEGGHQHQLSSPQSYHSGSTNTNRRLSNASSYRSPGNPSGAHNGGVTFAAANEAAAGAAHQEYRQQSGSFNNTPTAIAAAVPSSAMMGSSSTDIGRPISGQQQQNGAFHPTSPGVAAAAVPTSVDAPSGRITAASFGVGGSVDRERSTTPFNGTNGSSDNNNDFAAVALTDMMSPNPREPHNPRNNNNTIPTTTTAIATAASSGAGGVHQSIDFSSNNANSHGGAAGPAVDIDGIDLDF